MGSSDWWHRIRTRAALGRRPFVVLRDAAMMARHVPELVGKSEHEARCHIAAQLAEWQQSCTAQQAETFAKRLKGAHESWRATGVAKPYWSDLWVLRTYQAELTAVAPGAASRPEKPRQP